MTDPTQQQLIVYKCRVLAQLAYGLAPAAESTAIRKAFHTIADTLLDVAGEIANLELSARRSTHPLSRS